MNNRNRKLTIENVKRIPDLIEKGKSYLEVAETLNVSVRTINYWVRRLKFAGVKMNIKKGRKPMKL